MTFFLQSGRQNGHLSFMPCPLKNTQVAVDITQPTARKTKTAWTDSRRDAWNFLFIRTYNPKTTAMKRAVGTSPRLKAWGQPGIIAEKSTAYSPRTTASGVTTAAATAATSAVRRPLAEANQTPAGASR